MSCIVAHHNIKLYIEKGCLYDYMAYIDILFICEQVFDINFYGFEIK